MARSDLAQVIRLNLRRYGPDAAKQKHIEIARATLRRFLANDGSGPIVSIETDRREALSEDEVKPYGVIVYRFTRMRQIAAFALAEAIRLSPEASGRYKSGWFVMLNTAPVDPERIPNGADRVVIINDQPYARKIVTRGATRLGVPPGIVERIRQSVLKRFPKLVSANIEYIRLQGGYVLKTNGRLRRAKQDRRSSAFRGGRQFLATPKNRRAGQAMTYPAVVLTAKH